MIDWFKSFSEGSGQICLPRAPQMRIRYPRAYAVLYFPSPVSVDKHFAQ